VVSLLLISSAVAACTEDSPTGGASATAGEYTGDLPTVSGSFGEAPEVTFPGGDPPEQLQTEVIIEGDGPTVQAGDQLVAHYAGWLWEGGEPFDSSYDRGEPASFSIGAGRVIAGWDEGLVGQNTGSRVLLVVPPDLGYGDTGSGDSIPPDATLVFVVDIVNSVSRSSTGVPVADVPDGLPVVTGEQGSEPAVEFPDDAKPAATTDATLLIAGEGADIASGATLVADVIQYSWGETEPTYSSWPQAPVPLRMDDLPSLAEALAGQGAGSRVLVRVAAADNDGTPLALVVDVHGSY
jgi:peptidylprolyl isomerase